MFRGRRQGGGICRSGRLAIVALLGGQPHLGLYSPLHSLTMRKGDTHTSNLPNSHGSLGHIGKFPRSRRTTYSSSFVWPLKVCAAMQAMGLLIFEMYDV